MADRLEGTATLLARTTEDLPAFRARERGDGAGVADHVYASHPADDPFWTVEPGDPGPENPFHLAVCDRGAPALQALRNEIGDESFFEILKGWPARYAHGNARVGDFVAYAEEVSGESLGGVARHVPVPAGQAGRCLGWAGGLGFGGRRSHGAEVLEGDRGDELRS